MKLTSMTDFVLEQWEENDSSYDFVKKSINYAKFLKQPLTLGMFVPCDLDGNVLEEPKEEDFDMSRWDFQSSWAAWRQAKERCLFEGFFNTTESPQYKMYIQNGMQAVFYIARHSTTVKNIFGMRTIEDLIKDTPIQLTPTAIKQLGL